MMAYHRGTSTYPAKVWYSFILPPSVLKTYFYMDLLLISLIGFSLLIAIQVSVGVENTNHQQQFIIINQQSPDQSDDTNWVVALLITLGIIGLALLVMNQ